MLRGATAKEGTMLPVEISPWLPAPFALNGETVFAVGDVHGCLDEMTALLETIRTLAAESTGPRRLVYLGDMIDRGPSTTGVLHRWAEGEDLRGVDRIDRVIGNHEIIMLLTLRGEAQAGKAAAMWLADHTGGAKVLAEMRAAVRDPSAAPTYALATEALGEEVMRLLLVQRSHVAVGNTVFVHGGLEGGSEIEAFLATPWTAGMQARWAWITKGFLDWQAGFGGTLVVHGHTPPKKHRPLSLMEDTLVFQEDRLCLDGGSALTGIVAGAEIREGRYRLLKAGIARN
jgi:serine/threonine protein phosphatase 1